MFFEIVLLLCQKKEVAQCTQLILCAASAAMKKRAKQGEAEVAGVKVEGADRAEVFTEEGYGQHA